MFLQIRSLLSEGPGTQLEGPTVDIDETYVGGVRRYGRGRPMRGDKQKTPVVAIVGRKGNVIAKALPAATGADIVPLVRDHVVPESVIYTGQSPLYNGVETVLSRDGSPARLRHLTVKHADAYVRGDARTSSVEGFWMLVQGRYSRGVPLRFVQVFAGLFERIRFQVQSAV